MAWTKEKQAEYHRQYRLDNLEAKRAYDKARYAERKDYVLAQTKKRRQDHRAWVAELKSGPCSDCGGTFPHPVMEWHHRDPTTKSFCIGQEMARSKATLLAEIAKCDLLCANCHRMRTHA